jgi:hypothetical protein
MVLVARGAGVPASAIRRYGWALDATGSGYCQEVGAGAVPASARRVRGIAFTDDGAMYTTNTAPAATALRVDGFAVRADGALHINTGAVAGLAKAGANRDNRRVFG